MGSNTLGMDGQRAACCSLNLVAVRQGPSTVQAQFSSAETERGRIWLLAMKSFRRSRARGTG